MNINRIKKSTVCLITILLIATSTMAQEKVFKDLGIWELRYDPLKLTGFYNTGLDFQIAYKPKNKLISPQLGVRAIVNNLLIEHTLRDEDNYDFKTKKGVVAELGARFYLGQKRTHSVWFLTATYQYKNEWAHGVKGLVILSSGFHRIEYSKNIINHGIKFTGGCKLFRINEFISHEFEFGWGIKTGKVRDILPDGVSLNPTNEEHGLFFFNHIMPSLSYRLCFRLNTKH